MLTNLGTDRPVFIQLIDEIQMRILSGTYPRGGRIPSVRELASEFKVNPNTMQKALNELERTGLLNSQRTTGKFITENETLIQELRRKTAENEIGFFTERMMKYGYSRQEIFQLLQEFCTQEKEQTD